MRRVINQGFTLIEFIVVIVIMSIAGVALLSLFGESAKTLTVNQQVQTAAQYAQQCSEHIFAFRRDSNTLVRGYDNIPIGNGIAICNALPISGYTRTVNVSNNPGSPCPSTTPASECKKVDVTILNGATVRARTTFLLVKT